MHDIAQMLLMAAGGEAGQVSRTVGGAEAADIASASFTTAALSIGAAAANRLVVVAITVDDTDYATPVITGVTVGGSAAVELVRYSIPRQCTALWALAVPSGTTAAIGVTANTGLNAYAVAVEAVYGAIETPAYTVASVPGSGGGDISGIRNGLVLAATGQPSGYYNTGVVTVDLLPSGTCACQVATRLPTASGTVSPLNSGSGGLPYVAVSFAPK